MGNTSRKDHGDKTMTEEQTKRILDLWSGTGSATKPFEDHGYEVISVDYARRFEPTICADIMDVTATKLLKRNDNELYEFGWASPECTVYSIANINSRHFTEEAKPNSRRALEQNMRVQYTRLLLERTCKTWVMENPRGMLRTQYFMKDLPRATVTYCQYGDFRMKPTDLWGKFPRLWEAKPICSPGDDCHEAAPRGTAKSGTARLDRDERIKVPYELGMSFLKAIEDDQGGRPRSTLEEWL